MVVARYHFCCCTFPIQAHDAFMQHYLNLYCVIADSVLVLSFIGMCCNIAHVKCKSRLQGIEPGSFRTIGLLTG